MTERKRRAWNFGQAAEELAAWLLRAKGYRIIARGYRTRTGEIDIIARRGNLLAFVEVKARQNAAQAAEALQGPQRRRIERTAEAFLGSHPQYADCDVRFDVVLLAPASLPQHLAGAWMVGD